MISGPAMACIHWAVASFDLAIIRECSADALPMPLIETWRKSICQVGPPCDAARSAAVRATDATANTVGAWIALARMSQGKAPPHAPESLVTDGANP